VRSQDPTERLRALQSLVQDIAKTATATGPQGLYRTLQGARAVLEIGQSYVSNPQPPQVVLRRLFEKLGPTYIKLGQFIASSPTLFPEEYVLEFQKCLDRTEAIPWGVIKATIDSHLDAPADVVFSSINPVPLATASIAQVHRAVLRNSNKEVVIKVVKPGVEEVLQTDLNFLHVASKVVEFLDPELSRISLVDVVGDIRASMLEETDFTKEAQHIREFSTYLESSGMSRVATCPYVYRQHTSRRVLVMEYLEGVALTDLAAVSQVTDVKPDQVLINALNTWFLSLTMCPTFHADVHAGNLLVLRDGRIGFIDFGIVGKIPPATWMALQSLAEAFQDNNFDLMARSLVTVGMTDRDVNIPVFAKDLEQLFTEIEGLDPTLMVVEGQGGQAVSGSIQLDDNKMNQLLVKVVQVGEQNGLRFPREFALLVKQLLYFDRYNKILAPQMSMLKDDRISFSG